MDKSTDVRSLLYSTWLKSYLRIDYVISTVDYVLVAARDVGRNVIFYAATASFTSRRRRVSPPVATISSMQAGQSQFGQIEVLLADVSSKADDVPVAVRPSVSLSIRRPVAKSRPPLCPSPTTTLHSPLRRPAYGH